MCKPYKQLSWTLPGKHSSPLPLSSALRQGLSALQDAHVRRRRRQLHPRLVDYPHHVHACTSASKVNAESPEVLGSIHTNGTRTAL